MLEMGLSSTQVSCKRPSMKRQPHHQQQASTSEPLICPRCDSRNTKFCYFNNYNESQPRHYCRACKRHWTKGGTLRNVPVGGGRKHRREKKTAASSTAVTSTATNAKKSPMTTPASRDRKLISHMAIQTPQEMQHLPIVPVCTQKSFLHQPRIHEPSLMPQYDPTNTCDLEDKFSVGTKNSLFVEASAANDMLLQPQSHCLQFPPSSSSYCETNLSSMQTSFQSYNIYDHGEEFQTIDEPTNASMIMSSTCGNHAQTWQLHILDSGMDMPSSWNWDDVDSLVSTDLSTSQKDTDVKP